MYYFLNGGDEEAYLSSADWMTRNLDRRIELMFPIDDASHRAKVLQALRAMFRDNVKARWLGADCVYRRRERAPGESPFRVQQELQNDAQRTASRVRAGVVFQPEQRARGALTCRHGIMCSRVPGAFRFSLCADGGRVDATIAPASH